LDQNIIALFRKYMDKQCSKAELEKVISIFQNGSYPEEFEYALNQDADNIINADDDTKRWNEVSKLDLHHRISTSIAGLKKASQPRRFSGILRMATVTAAACILLCFGWFLYDQQESQPQQVQYENDVAPGKPGASLRLPNGRQISLNGQKAGVVIKGDHLSYNDGSDVGVNDKLATNEMYSASTAPGNTYILTLPDGTQVWLNADSQLDFPAKFGIDSRVVSLKGEAFFKVIKDKRHPFIVESKGQQIKVLGTEFNINSYADEKSTKTTVIEGSVQVNSADQNAVLKPGQQSSTASDGTIVISEADTALATAWKNNKFIFEDSDIKSVMRMIQRWYNVDVVYNGNLPDASFGGKVSRYNNVSIVLHVLEATGGAHFKIKGRTIFVSK
jgi:transmembrane sensor